MATEETLPPILSYLIADIKIPPSRQRSEATADEMLITSIRENGLINPIIIHSDGSLVAGERRLDAFRKLSRTHIPARIFEDLPPIKAFEIELHENLARKQLSWQEEVKAVGRYHQLRVTAFPSWTRMGTATALGVSNAQITKLLAIADAIQDADIAACPTLQGAYNLITARAERAQTAALSRGLVVSSAAASLLPPVNPNHTPAERTAALMKSLQVENIASSTVSDLDKNIRLIEQGRIATAQLEAQKKLEVVNDLVLCTDFLDWSADYSGPKFDVIHCDFPYGKNYSGARTRKTGKVHIAPVYADDPDIYYALVDGFLKTQDAFTHSAAHCIFWFDMSYYAWTVDQFTAAGWTLIQPYPFIWTKGYQGIAADVKRRPRHVYETALLFSRGDRKITKLDKDHYDCPIDEKLHLNQKPHTMLKHLLGIFVDEHTAVLDPTCGSGSALVAAASLGSYRYLGLELDPDNADVARFLLQRHDLTSAEGAMEPSDDPQLGNVLAADSTHEQNPGNPG